MAELIMSIDRMIRSAETAQSVAGQWAPQVVLGHISQVDEQVWIPRIGLMCQAQADGKPAPEFTWWEPDARATEQKFQSHSIPLAAEQWGATAKHETFGVIDVAALIIEVLTHDEEHRASLV